MPLPEIPFVHQVAVSYDQKPPVLRTPFHILESRLQAFYIDTGLLADLSSTLQLSPATGCVARWVVCIGQSYLTYLGDVEGVAGSVGPGADILCLSVFRSIL